MKHPRVLLALGVLVAALAGAVVLMSSEAGTNSGREAKLPDAPRTRTPLPVVRSKLTLAEADRQDAGTELLISLPKTRLNTPEATGGERSVTLTCFDASGATAFSVPQPWPLMEEFGYPLPHLHVPVGPQLLGTIRRCRLTGPGIDFEGRVPGRIPLAR